MRQALSPDALAIYETPLSPEEFDRRLREALADEEQMQRNRELCQWFLRRYPTAGERLAYARRKYAEWTRECEITGPDAESRGAARDAETTRHG